MAEISDSTGEDKTRTKDPTKRPTFAEKLMGVRNSQCEHYLQKTQQQIELDELRNIQRLREDTNLITYDLKTMKVMKKKRDLEIKKSKSPFLDTEQEEFEIRQAERYLVFDPSICFYTNKKNQYPLRSQAKQNPHQVTPTVSKARKILQDMTNERKVQEIQQKRVAMHSRKSGHSVRFHTPDDRSFVSKSSTATNSYNTLKDKTRNQSRNAAPESKADPEQSIVTFLQKAKSYSQDETDNLQKYSILNEEAIPDDFTQCVPDHASREIQVNESKKEDILHLPAVTSEQKSQTYVNMEMRGAPSLDETDRDIPHRHEKKPSSEANSQFQSEQVRISKSASAASRYANNASPIHRRSTSASSSSKKNQFTHAMMRKENKEVQSKVSNFLRAYDKSKKRTYNSNMKLNNYFTNRPESRQTVTFKVTEDSKSDLLEVTSNDPQQTGLKSKSFSENITRASESEIARTHSEQPAYQSTMNPLLQRNDKAKSTKVHGMPHHSESRAKRHSPTFKLQRMVKELLKNRTTTQQLEYEKMKMEATQMEKE